MHVGSSTGAVLAAARACTVHVFGSGRNIRRPSRSHSRVHSADAAGRPRPPRRPSPDHHVPVRSRTPTRSPEAAARSAAHPRLRRQTKRCTNKRGVAAAVHAQSKAHATAASCARSGWSCARIASPVGCIRITPLPARSARDSPGGPPKSGQQATQQATCRLALLSHPQPPHQAVLRQLRRVCCTRCRSCSTGRSARMTTSCCWSSQKGGVSPRVGVSPWVGT